MRSGRYCNVSKEKSRSCFGHWAGICGADGIFKAAKPTQEVRKGNEDQHYNCLFLFMGTGGTGGMDRRIHLQQSGKNLGNHDEYGERWKLVDAYRSYLV